MARKTNMSFRPIVLTALLVVGGVALSASGLNVLDFESIPSGSLIDDMQIGDQYEATHGMRFRLDLDADGLPDGPGAQPWLEQIGGTKDDFAFTYDTGHLVDSAAPGFEGQLGDYFLRGTLTPYTLIVLYFQPMAEVSGEIWDLDGTRGHSERWRIDVMGPDYLANNDATDVVASLISPEQENLTWDGRPWEFSLARQERDIHALRLEFIGSKTDRVGGGFDNFSATVPEPATVGLMVFGGVGLLRRWRRG